MSAAARLLMLHQHPGLGPQLSQSHPATLPAPGPAKQHAPTLACRCRCQSVWTGEQKSAGMIITNKGGVHSASSTKGTKK
mmetsp:Transcript_9658/g.23985  ORF Transcript_9658/g.23985 Transcript_9658/m.23985 type:complete len:80 (+) Transcript_9658:185-424(+)